MIRYVIKYNNEYYVGSNNSYNSYRTDEYNINIKYAKKYKSLNSILHSRIFRNHYDFKNDLLRYIKNIENITLIERTIKISKILNREIPDINLWKFLRYKIEVVEIENNKIINLKVLNEVEYYLFLCDKINKLNH